MLYVLIICIGTIIHEMGHFTVAHFIYANPKLHYSSCDWHPTEDQVGGVHEIVFHMGGILLPTVLSTIATVLLLVKKTFNPTQFHLLVIAGTLSFRSFFIITLFIINSLGLSQHNSYDEAKLNILLELPNGFIEVLSAIYSIMILFALLFLLHKNGHNLLRYLSRMAAGILIGFFLWFKILGPVILP